MQPIKKVFGRFPRVVRDLSRALNKEINLELIGEETDLDKNLVEALADPLVHLVRNSVDHGIESPEVRQSSGKNRAGTITLSAKQEGDHILLVIKDDGAGMSAEKLRSKAIEKGLLDSDTAARLDEHECYNLIFMPGFSTKSEISDISGRGVGMDVVKTRISQLNGNVEIHSQEGKGTEIKIKLPLTLAIVPTLMVIVGEQIFAIPLANVNEIIQYESVRKNIVDGQTVAIVREHPLPLFYLRNWLLRSFKDEGKSYENSYIVVIKIGVTHIACVVDHLISQEEVVIKPLGALLHGLPGLSGATITGDGRIAIILDMPSLISRYGGRIK
jgi:two-component system chemotaxis sensor kinase CheA